VNGLQLLRDVRYLSLSRVAAVGDVVGVTTGVSTAGDGTLAPWVRLAWSRLQFMRRARKICLRSSARPTRSASKRVSSSEVPWLRTPSRSIVNAIWLMGRRRSGGFRMDELLYKCVHVTSWYGISECCISLSDTRP
jgi:hypothetical protein